MPVLFFFLLLLLSSSSVVFLLNLSLTLNRRTPPILPEAVAVAAGLVCHLPSAPKFFLSIILRQSCRFDEK
uniref:Secreted protein n=1 Tax=Anopheles darlingi TaxID=43151 RepID=A0A2M4D9Y5_ANODA